MSGCPNKYGGYNGNRDGCSRGSHSTSVFYFISTIAAMIVLGAVTILFFCCIYYKRRRIHERLRNARNRGQTPATNPITYIWPGSASEVPESPASSMQPTQTATEADRLKGIPAGVEPLSCVIMAGEERPTFLARPLPKESFEDVNIDNSLDQLERGKQRHP